MTVYIFSSSPPLQFQNQRSSKCATLHDWQSIQNNLPDTPQTSTLIGRPSEAPPILQGHWVAWPCISPMKASEVPDVVFGSLTDAQRTEEHSSP